MRRRLKLTLAYEGTAYAGWQAQPHGRTVQQVVEKALKRILGHPVRLIGASRTDAGAHAVGQVAHFDTGSPIPLTGLKKALNAVLPKDIAVHRVEEVDDHFHARFSAKSRTYRYEILNRPDPDPLLARRAYHVPQRLSVAAMRAAARVFRGRRDFSSVCLGSSGVHHPVRTVTSLRISRRGTRITMTITADGFLRGMIRMIVQALVDAGLGRSATPKAAPPHGLYLVKVKY